MYELFRPRALKLDSGYVITCPSGKHARISDKEFLQFKRKNIGKELYHKLSKAGIIITNANKQAVVNAYRNSKQFHSPEIHEIEIGSLELSKRLAKFLSGIPSKRLKIVIRGDKPLEKLEAIKLLLKSLRHSVSLEIYSDMESMNKERLRILNKFKAKMVVPLPIKAGHWLTKIEVIGIPRVSAKILSTEFSGLKRIRLEPDLFENSKRYVKFWQALIESLVNTDIIELETLELYKKAVLGGQSLTCGAVINRLAYDSKGSIFPCYNAMLADEEFFKLGNIQSTYQELIKSQPVISMLKSEFAPNPACSKCAFSPYCENCVVDNFLEHGSPSPIAGARLCRIRKQQYEQIFKWAYGSTRISRMLKAWIKTKDL